jgi:hypothetical protein
MNILWEHLYYLQKIKVYGSYSALLFLYCLNFISVWLFLSHRRKQSVGKTLLQVNSSCQLLQIHSSVTTKWRIAGSLMRKHNRRRPQGIVILLIIISKGQQHWQMKDLAWELDINTCEISDSFESQCNGWSIG